MKTIASRGIAFIREVLASPQKRDFRYRDLGFFLRYLRPIRRLGAVSFVVTMILVGLRALVPLSGKVFLDYLVPHPTSALDARTEERLQASLAELAGGRTVMLITHRTGLLALADRVYAIEDGRLVKRAAAGEAA